MEEQDYKIVVSQFESIINILNPSMDDYLYIYDLKNDYFFISPSAVGRFRMPENRFHDVTDNLKKFVYEADWDELREDLSLVADNKKDFHNMEYRWLDREGNPVWINCRGRVARDEQGNAEFLIGCINEIGLKQKADNVSGALRERSLQGELGRYQEERLTGFILRIGIDNFKEINENRGLDYGDMILRKTAKCIEESLEEGQKFYRIVADEFIVLDLMGGHGEAAAVQLYKKIRQTLDKFIEQNFYDVFFTVSSGILCLDGVQSQEYGNLMKLSEFALNEAKNRGKNQYYVFDSQDYKIFLHRRELIKIMRQAVNRQCDGFEVFFQPIVDIGRNCLLGAETLLRFHTEEWGMISPMEFIPLLEETGLIIPVGKWVLEKALEACSEIQKFIPNFRISVNLSYIQILKSNVLNEILSAVEKYSLQPGSLMIELTESGFMETSENFKKFCQGLHEHGILLALDDFGTGYSNFHYLYNLNPDTIKIDRSFTVKALNNDYEYNLLNHMVAMTHSINLKLCIEGIETDKELARISQINPDYIQGYYFGKPCPFKAFLSEHVPAACG